MTPTIQYLHREFVEIGGLTQADFDFLADACGPEPDLQRLRRLLRRRQLGEPREYVVGYQEFRGRRFAVDKRVYITDPEAARLVDVVVDKARAASQRLSRPPTIVELGVGCGSLAISVKKDVPDATLIGLDLDGDAIAVAMKNASEHHTDVLLIESDLFSDLPRGIVPDIIFADPPWGDESSLYGDDRPASHYLAMPILSAFPPGGITGVHEAILRDVAARNWACEVILNFGILADEHIARLAAMAKSPEILRFDNASVLLCKMS